MLTTFRSTLNSAMIASLLCPATAFPSLQLSKPGAPRFPKEIRCGRFLVEGRVSISRRGLSFLTVYPGTQDAMSFLITQMPLEVVLSLNAVTAVLEVNIIRRSEGAWPIMQYGKLESLGPTTEEAITGRVFHELHAEDCSFVQVGQGGMPRRGR